MKHAKGYLLSKKIKKKLQIVLPETEPKKIHTKNKSKGRN